MEGLSDGLNMVKVLFSLHACCNLTGSGRSHNSIKPYMFSIIILSFVVPVFAQSFGIDSGFLKASFGKPFGTTFNLFVIDVDAFSLGVY